MFLSHSTTHNQSPTIWPYFIFVEKIFRENIFMRVLVACCCEQTIFMIMSWRIYSLVYAFNYVLINFERCSVVFTVFVHIFFDSAFAAKRMKKVTKSWSLTAGANNVLNTFSSFFLIERKINIDELHQHEISNMAHTNLSLLTSFGPQRFLISFYFLLYSSSWSRYSLCSLCMTLFSSLL